MDMQFNKVFLGKLYMAKSALYLRFVVHIAFIALMDFHFDLIIKFLKAVNAF